MAALDAPPAPLTAALDSIWRADIPMAERRRLCRSAVFATLQAPAAGSHAAFTQDVLHTVEAAKSLITSVAERSGDQLHNIGDVIRWLRLQGGTAAALAKRLQRLSKVRNARAHPDTSFSTALDAYTSDFIARTHASSPSTAASVASVVVVHPPYAQVQWRSYVFPWEDSDTVAPAYTPSVALTEELSALDAFAMAATHPPPTISHLSGEVSASSPSPTTTQPPLPQPPLPSTPPSLGDVAAGHQDAAPAVLTAAQHLERTKYHMGLHDALLAKARTDAKLTEAERTSKLHHADRARFHLAQFEVLREAAVS